MNALVTLRNGTEVPAQLVGAVTLSLELLMETDPIALFELVMLARNPQHKPFGKTGATLIESRLLERGGRMHDATRDVVLASSEGDGPRLRLVSPYAGSAS